MSSDTKEEVSPQQEWLTRQRKFVNDFALTGSLGYIHRSHVGDTCVHVAVFIPFHNTRINAIVNKPSAQLMAISRAVQNSQTAPA